MNEIAKMEHIVAIVDDYKKSLEEYHNKIVYASQQMNIHAMMGDERHLDEYDIEDDTLDKAKRHLLRIEEYLG